MTDDSEFSTDSASEIAAPAPGELASKIFQLRAKGDAKNNPKKPKTPAAPRLDTGALASVSGENSAAESGIAESGIAESGIGAKIHKKSEEGRSDMNSLQPINEKLESLVSSVENLTASVANVSQEFDVQNSAREKAFDALYEELNAYKNDFFYERLKPTLRSLLFLLDSIKEFEREIENLQKNGAEVHGEVVAANLIHFREQLTDVFSLSEMAPIEAPNEQFNAKTQRAVQIVKVEAAQNNTVQREVRGGWTLGGKILRPADVVVGKSN